ncbi:adenylate/guanylate cyclase domain-containing protein [Mycobacterium sp. IS-1556]|uniref:ATP-binding protein n=1 Tax=Mycobacterium sp. IS-1556 TaxID=1772276 RepID=UPI000AC05B17
MSGGQEAAPSGIVTFLFTDIEGSTRRWEADPEGMRRALTVHDDTLRRAVKSHEGWLFKHTGDGICAAFASPRHAVDAAVVAQRSLEIPVRMGVATGEAECRDSDYFGAVLNRTARLMGAGHGGQILLDGATAGLLTGVDLISLGPRRLRDIAKAVEIFQVRAPGLRTDFPALRTVEPATGKLRRPTTSFVGREKELAELVTTLKAHRVVTLTGVGGVGKTRLALELADRSADDFPDGVFVIELSPVGDPAAVPEIVAAALGVVQQPGLSLTESVAAASEGRTRLLVFDNCEHLLDAAADVIEAILAQSTTVKMLATSREGLGLTDERLWLVPSLDVESSAATLFVERAAAVTSAAPSLAHSEAVADICRRLDGIPLAIELAASRMQSMTAAELRDRLDDRFRLLVGSRRGLERHQTLRHAVQWSFDLLSDGEKSLLARCSVFAGGFDLTAACVLADNSDELATLNLLDSLVRKSLLVADRSSVHTRFTVLETIRQFAEEQLVSSGNANAVRAAHARHFARKAAEAKAEWNTPRQRKAHEWLALELANLRAAFRWAASEEDLEAATAVAVHAAFLGYSTEQWEPVGWVEEIIPRAEAVRHPRLAQLYVAATYCAAVGRVHEFVHYAEAARAAIESGRFDAVDDELGCAVAAGYNTVGQAERAIDWCRFTLARSPDPHTASRTVLAVTLAFSGATEEAVALSEDMLTAVQDAHNSDMLAAVLLGYGWARRDTDPASAYEALLRGLTISTENGNRQQASIIALLLSRVAATAGKPGEALDHILLTIRQYYDSGSVLLLSTVSVCSPRCWTTSDTTSLRLPSAASPRAASRSQPSPKSAPRLPICALS